MTLSASSCPRPLLRGVALILCVFLLLTAPAPPARATAPEPAPDPIERVVELTNAERAKVGLPPLIESRELAASAGWYAQVLAATDCYAHTCGPVPDLEDRCAMAGYPETTMLGENVAAARPTPEAVVRDWMASPDHRANILRPEFTELGVGLATGGRWGTYWVQNFGTRH